MNRQTKIRLENGTILLLGAAAFVLLAASLLPSSAMSEKVRSYLEMNRMVERAFAAMLLVLSSQLMKRKRSGLGNDHGCTDFKPPAGTGRDNTYRHWEAGSLFLLVQAAVIFRSFCGAERIFAARPLKGRWNRPVGFVALIPVGCSCERGHHPPLYESGSGKGNGLFCRRALQPVWECFLA